MTRFQITKAGPVGGRVREVEPDNLEPPKVFFVDKLEKFVNLKVINFVGKDRLVGKERGGRLPGGGGVASILGTKEEDTIFVGFVLIDAFQDIDLGRAVSHREKGATFPFPGAASGGIGVFRSIAMEGMHEFVPGPVGNAPEVGDFEAQEGSVGRGRWRRQRRRGRQGFVVGVFIRGHGRARE